VLEKGKNFLDPKDVYDATVLKVRAVILALI
jgi:hypothetical protein